MIYKTSSISYLRILLKYREERRRYYYYGLASPFISLEKKLSIEAFRFFHNSRSTITRIYYINSNVSKLFYLRYLLSNIISSLFFEDLRIINDSIISIFYSIYIIRDLLYNNVK